MQGTVKWFNSAKGFGFIATGDGSKDVFVHQKEVVGDAVLTEGDTVDFVTEPGPKGPQAKSVTKT
jgi:CspA family cold shock protein